MSQDPLSFDDTRSLNSQTGLHTSLVSLLQLATDTVGTPHTSTQVEMGSGKDPSQIRWQRNNYNMLNIYA